MFFGVSKNTKENNRKKRGEKKNKKGAKLIV
jgi:hypothetical protein